MTRLDGALVRAGHDSRVRFRTGRGLSGNSKRVDFSMTPMDRALERVRYSFENRLLVPDPASYYSRMRLHRATPCPSEDLNCDVIHLHWVGRWLDLPSFLDCLPVQTPIIWTIHDMSPLAGGCFTYSGCEGFASGCQRCPLLKSPFNRFLSAREFQRRLAALKQRRLFVVGNSKFTTGLARRSGLFEHAERILTIHPSLDPEQFIPLEKCEAKQLLGIKANSFVLGFGAAALSDVNKGLSHFYEVAERVGRRIDGGVTALVFGDGPLPGDISNVKTIALGCLTNSSDQSVAYSAMDGFIVASTMETFGQVAIEAQACGTPVWAFDVGGLGDAINSGVTGHLIPFPDVAMMAHSISAAHESGIMQDMGASAVDWVRAHFSVEEMGLRYAELYTEAVNLKSVGIA